jgi:hypothetical protein
MSKVVRHEQHERHEGGYYEYKTVAMQPTVANQ